MFLQVQVSGLRHSNRLDTREREHLQEELPQQPAISSETSVEKWLPEKILFKVETMELQELVALARESKGSGGWTPAVLIRVGGILAGKINSVQNLSGTEKLKLVQRVLLQVLAEAENKEIAEPNLSKEDVQKIHDRYDVLEAAIADVLPASLELALKVARGGLDLKKIKPSTWVKLCSCFATSVVHQLASMNLISEAHATQARQLLVQAEEKASAVAVAKEAAEEPPKVSVEEPLKKEETPSTESPSVEEKKESETATPAPVDA